MIFFSEAVLASFMSLSLAFASFSHSASRFDHILAASSLIIAQYIAKDQHSNSLIQYVQLCLSSSLQFKLFLDHLAQNTSFIST